jgi:hypothetical protein
MQDSAAPWLACLAGLWVACRLLQLLRLLLLIMLQWVALLPLLPPLLWCQSQPPQVCISHVLSKLM